MFCQKCGKEADNDAIICVNCGCALQPEKLAKNQYMTNQYYDTGEQQPQYIESQEQYYQYNNDNNEEIKIKEDHTINFNSNKVALGIIFAIAFGIIGLIAGLLLYPVNTRARKSFVLSWAITMIILFAIVLTIYILLIEFAIISYDDLFQYLLTSFSF